MSSVAQYERLIAINHPDPQCGQDIMFQALRHVVADNAHLSQRDWHDTYQRLQGLHKSFIRGNYEKSI